MFAQILHHIEDKDLALDATANGLLLKSVQIKRFEVKADGEIGDCIEKEFRKYLNGELHSSSIFPGEDKVIEALSQEDVSKNKFNYQKYGRKTSRWCKVEFSTLENDLPPGILSEGYTRLVFKLDQEDRLQSLAQVSGNKENIPAVYLRFYEAFDEHGNWTQMRETIEQETFMVNRKIQYF